MISIRLKRLFKMRGIKQPYGWMVKNGLPVVAARKFSAENYTHLPINHLEKLCLMLRCTPNDLLAWEPKAGTDTTNQPLAALIRPVEDDELKWIEQLETLDIDDLRAVARKIKDLKQGGGEEK